MATKTKKKLTFDEIVKTIYNERPPNTFCMNVFLYDHDAIKQPFVMIVGKGKKAGTGEVVKLISVTPDMQQVIPEAYRTGNKNSIIFMPESLGELHKIYA